jgi:hypothetical protein
MRLALNARRELTALASDDASERTKWFRLMGTPPLRKVVEGALGLPAGVGTLDIDRQLDEFRDRAAERFGTDTIAGLAEPATLERLLDRFTAVAGTARSAAQATSPALILLRGF